ncbi:MAG: hypothetical protein AB1611_16980 [bacterium]
MKSTEAIELFNIFSETWGKEKAQVVVKDIEAMIDSEKQKLATKGDLREVELRLTKEIEQAKSRVSKWVVGWMAGLLIAQTGAIVTIFMLLK